MSWFIKYLIVTSLIIWFLVLMSCKHIKIIDCEQETFVHSCPEQGHGECPICPPKQQYIDLSVLDYHCVDCELVYEYEIYFIPELEEDEKVLALD